MNQLNGHNNMLKEAFESFDQTADRGLLDSLVDLDSIDDVLRANLPIADMKQAGSFFTGQKISSLAVDGLEQAITSDSVVLDPTCGAGNLLIEVSRRIGVEATLSKTLSVWGSVLRGFDIYDFFVEATKLRIILEALRRGVKKDCSLEQAMDYMSGIVTIDAMSISSTDISDVTHTVMNPPFSIWESPKTKFWKKGKVNAAGIISEHFISILPEKCSLSAILPDVLRSGSRYENWREFVSTTVSGNCKVIGQFNQKTGVDVFLLSGMCSPSEDSISWYNEAKPSKKLSDNFDVCVGPLVAYRDPEVGPVYPYIHPKNAPQWKTVREFDEYRAFSGRSIDPPFLVVRRTSSPSDKYRASASIIAGKKPVAVENHLIVIQPKNGKMKECRDLLNILKSDSTNNFLNERIRLRHLTVGVIKDIPIEAEQ